MPSTTISRGGSSACFPRRPRRPTRRWRSSATRCRTRRASCSTASVRRSGGCRCAAAGGAPPQRRGGAGRRLRRDRGPARLDPRASPWPDGDDERARPRHRHVLGARSAPAPPPPPPRRRPPPTAHRRPATGAGIPRLTAAASDAEVREPCLSRVVGRCARRRRAHPGGAGRRREAARLSASSWGLVRRMVRPLLTSQAR